MIIYCKSAMTGHRPVFTSFVPIHLSVVEIRIPWLETGVGDLEPQRYQEVGYGGGRCWVDAYGKREQYSAPSGSGTVISAHCCLDPK